MGPPLLVVGFYVEEARDLRGVGDGILDGTRSEGGFLTFDVDREPSFAKYASLNLNISHIRAQQVVIEKLAFHRLNLFWSETRPRID